MAEIADVVGGEIITDTWGNAIRDRVIMRYATTGALPAATDGTVAYVDADDRLYLRRAGAWTLAGPLGRVAYVEKIASQAGLTSQTDLTGLSVTFTAVSGRAYRLSAEGLFARSGSATPDFALMQIKHTSGSPIYKEIQIHTPSNAYALNGGGSIVETGLSGSLTIKVSAGGSGGAVELGATTQNPATLLVEDLGT